VVTTISGRHCDAHRSGEHLLDCLTTDAENGTRICLDGQRPRFDKGRITRTDVYTPKGRLDIASIRLDFASFSHLLTNTPLSGHLSGAITDFRVEGLDAVSWSLTYR
jgi:hypothetical protein